MESWPKRLHHNIPGWVRDGAVFHIRVRLAKEAHQDLTESKIGTGILESVTIYHQRGLWYNHLFLLMPDHWHALLSFAPDKGMSRVVGDWKRFHARRHGLAWQVNYFDHRIRNDREFMLKAAYIRNNPVARKLCRDPSEWPWIISSIAKIP